MAPPIAAPAADESSELLETSSSNKTAQKILNKDFNNRNENLDATNIKANTQASTKQDASKPTGEGELSGRDKKLKAKAEKQAKRAQDKQQRQGQPIVNPPGANQTERSNNIPRRRGSTAAQNVSAAQGPQHRRTGSTNQRVLPLRPTDAQAASSTPEPKKEEKKVALFDHLYGQPRRTTLAGAGKDIHPAILALGLQISSYVICGSNARCVAMLLAFKQLIQSYTTPLHTALPRHLTTHLSSQIDYLVSCRPLSVSMGNAIRWLKLEISSVDITTPESAAKKDLFHAIDNFIRERITIADELIAKKGSEKIRDGDIILTYGKSSIVQRTLAKAFQDGKKFKVIVVDSRPLFEGKNLASSLSQLGLEVQYALINSIDGIVKSATKAFLGAHAMMSNGRLYSRIGSALVAMAAHEAKIPVIVCCESIKFTDRVALDSFVHNEIAPPDELVISGAGLDGWRDVPNLQVLNLMYDLTPAEYINMVITEYGPLPPSSVPVVHRLSTNT